MTLADQIRQLCRRMYAGQFTGKAPELLELADLAEALERDRDEAIEQALHFKSALIERAKGPAMTSPTLTPYIEAAEYAAEDLTMAAKEAAAMGAPAVATRQGQHAARLRALAEALREAKIGWHHSDGQGMYDVFPDDDPEQLRLEGWQQQWFIPAPKEEA